MELLNNATIDFALKFDGRDRLFYLRSLIDNINEATNSNQQTYVNYTVIAIDRDSFKNAGGIRNRVGYIRIKNADFRDCDFNGKCAFTTDVTTIIGGSYTNIQFAVKRTTNSDFAIVDKNGDYEPVPVYLVKSASELVTPKILRSKTSRENNNTNNTNGGKTKHRSKSKRISKKSRKTRRHKKRL